MNGRRQILERILDSNRIDFGSFPFDGRRFYVLSTMRERRNDAHLGLLTRTRD